MGCVSSNLLHGEDDITRLGSSALSHHIVSLTSTTYGFLNLDPPPQNPNPSPQTTIADSKPLRSDPDAIINSWELMAGLDNTESFRFNPIPKPKTQKSPDLDKENSNPNLNTQIAQIERFEPICPPTGENRVVIYTTSLRGVRRTFEACAAVRSAIEAHGVQICERDVSMDLGFREELRSLMEGKGRDATVPPRVFVKGLYLGGAEEVLRIADEGHLGNLLNGLPKRGCMGVCGGCGGVGFLPCFHCGGSCKVVVVKNNNNPELGGKKMGKRVVLRCCECNENGLLICPICR